MALARSQREWSILIGEYNICKKKLESKREALKIMKKEWQTVQRERDIYKNKINQLQQDLDKYTTKDKQKPPPVQKEQPTTPCRAPERKKPTKSPDLFASLTSRDSLAQLVVEYKGVNKALRKDFLELKKLYVESQEDVQILRDRMRNSSSSSSIGEDSSSTCVNEGKEELILQLEEYKGQVVSLEQELKTIRDDSSDVTIERDHHKDKCERLNTQLNYILGADDRRLVDIDALVLDNKYLKEKLTQLQEERNLEKESIQKYEAAFEKKKNKLLYRGYVGDRMSLYNSKSSNDHSSSKTIADLRNVANILSETITEKNLALTHQRNANRILGKRVSELENKLKTLEVSGLWSLPGHRGYGSINLKTNASHDLNGQDNANNVAGTTVERLEWDDSVGLVELTDSEKAEFLEKAVLENVDFCKKAQDCQTPDLISRLATGRGSCQGIGADHVVHDNGCQGDCLGSGILNKSQNEVDEEIGSGTFQGNSQKSRQFYVPCLNNTSALQKLSRAISAPSLFSESFDENENVNGGDSPDFSDT